MKNCLFTTPKTTTSRRGAIEKAHKFAQEECHTRSIFRKCSPSRERDESYFLFVNHVISISTMTCWSNFASAFIWHWNHSDCYSWTVESWLMRVKKVNTFFFSSNAGDCRLHKLAVYRTRRRGKMRETWLTKRFTRAAHRRHRSFSGFSAMQGLIRSGFWDCFRWKSSTFSLSLYHLYYSRRVRTETETGDDVNSKRSDKLARLFFRRNRTDSALLSSAFHFF